MSFSLNEIEELIDLAHKHRLTCLEVCQGERALRIELSPSVEPLADPTSSRSPQQEEHLVRAPWVGYFHLPESGLAKGEFVEPHTPIGVIEALGLPNEVLAGVKGTFEGFLVKEGQPVEYGQPLAKIQVTS
jgi:acetyl-CoA carboxylase biotin carboxyl carrier protein